MFLKNNYITKIYRTITAFLPIDKKRQGHCRNCGKCCSLPRNCLFLKNKDGKKYCSIYKIRPLVCRKYPRVEKESLNKEDCGFYFNK
ncbi:MAG TPA: YkgJ family cysteine cluster protein [bacterium]|nr:YkgJ family cysteine cluster protein [bacterium]